MSSSVHKRAEALMAAARVEGLSQSDRAWLDAHLGECASCSAQVEALEKAIAALRSIPAALDPAVVEATRRRVRARAREWREHQARLRGLWLACAFSWLLGALSAPVLWFGFKWVGQRFEVPQPLWITALTMYWLVPAVAGAAALAWRRSKNSHSEDRAGDVSR